MIGDGLDGAPGWFMICARAKWRGWTGGNGGTLPCLLALIPATFCQPFALPFACVGIFQPADIFIFLSLGHLLLLEIFGWFLQTRMALLSWPGDGDRYICHQLNSSSILCLIVCRDRCIF